MDERCDRITCTSRMSSSRAGCDESRTSGSEGGPRKQTGRKAGTALRPDPYTYVWTVSGFCYAAFIVDAFSPESLAGGWRPTCGPILLATPSRWRSGPARAVQLASER